MKCKRKMQKRRDVLTVIGMIILLAFILRMWPIPAADADRCVFLRTMDAVPNGRGASAAGSGSAFGAASACVGGVGAEHGFLSAPAQDHRAGAAAVSQCQMGVGCCRCPGAVRPRRRAEHPAQPRRRIPESGGAGETTSSSAGFSIQRPNSRNSRRQSRKLSRRKSRNKSRRQWTMAFWRLSGWRQISRRSTPSAMR